MRVDDAHQKLSAKGGLISASECVEIFAQATITKGLAHPSHPHAHLAKDGFHEAEPNSLFKLRNQRLVLDMKRGHASSKELQEKYKKQLDELDKQIDKAEKRLKTGAQEGVHLDAKIRNEYIDPDTALAEDYTGRDHHSQFEDSEAAAMALFYALNCPAGVKALSLILSTKQHNRAVLYSKSAANGLAYMSSLAPAPSKDVVSYHPGRSKGVGMIDRHKGGSGAATTSAAAIDRVVTILTRDPSGNLVLTTHYPVSTINLKGKIAGPALAVPYTAHDYIEWGHVGAPPHPPKQFGNAPVGPKIKVSW